MRYDGYFKSCAIIRTNFEKGHAMIEIDEKTLPLAIQKDIEALKAWHRGEKEKGLGGVLYTELYGSINGSQWGNEISKETADYLRAKYLGYKNGIDVEFYFDKNSIYDNDGKRRESV